MIQLTSNIISLKGFAESCQGGRPENQDDFGSQDTPLGHLTIVCDGMGGGPGGKTASHIVKTEIIRIINECESTESRETALKMAATKANDQLMEQMRIHPELAGMGSTLVAILINKQSAFVAFAGDSRCYRIHGKHVLFRTQDHSLVGELVRSKALTEEEARTSPQSNVISRGLGSIANHVPEIIEVPYKKGDKFILCTDGVWGSMPHKDLLSHFFEKGSNDLIIKRLSEQVDRLGKKNGGHHDNHTIAIIEMGCDSIKKEEKKNIFHSLMSIFGK